MQTDDGWLKHQARSHTLFHLAVYAIAVALAVVGLGWLAPVLSPVLAAAGIAYLLAPLVDRLARRGVPRAAAAAILLVGFALVVVGGVALLVPLIIEDITRFVPRVPELAERGVRWVEATFGVKAPADWRQAVVSAKEQLGGLAAAASGPIVRTLALALGGVFSFLVGLLELLVIPVFAFYFLVDWPRIVGAVRELIPPRRRDAILGVAAEIDGVISTWVRGQLVVVGVQAIIYTVALSLLGIQLAVPIGILAGVLSFIPYVGVGVGLSLAMLMALLDWHGWGQIAAVGGIFTGVQILESFILTPLLVGKKVGLGEAGALFAVIAGGQLLGFVGMMLAIPLAAAVAVILRRLHRHYVNTEFYVGQAREAAEAAAAAAAAAGGAAGAAAGRAVTAPETVAAGGQQARSEPAPAAAGPVTEAGPGAHAGVRRASGEDLSERADD